jgi:ribosomal protein L6P/L9E
MLNNPLFDLNTSSKHIKIKNNVSSSKRQSDCDDKNDQKTTKSDAQQSAMQRPHGYASIINNNIQGLSINYSNHIMPSIPG